MPDNVTRLRTPKPCPICSKPSIQQYHPFCSVRCADVDLNRWLKGNYVIPGAKSSADEDEADTPIQMDED
ncbi:DNA gyrase inhibitor YacG [Pelagibacterium sp.]|uniref:DNA gyrase inhibitor YacG n=1 Tax=Pelagibacterium sp. TaxID=1967288 RepID=UPI003A92BAD1